MSILLDRKEYQGVRDYVARAGTPITNEGVPIGALELRRQLTTPNGEVVLVQFQVEMVHASAHWWNANLRKWVPLTELPEENPEGAALHPEDHGPGGYKEIPADES